MLYAHCLDVVNVGYLMCRRYFIGPYDSLLKYSTAHLKAERHVFTIQFGIVQKKKSGRETVMY
jgi:hypothetical protein